MEALAKNNIPTLFSETFSHGRMRYFFDLNLAGNATHYLKISSSELFNKDQYRRQTILFWEEDLFFLVEAIYMVLKPVISGEAPRLFQRAKMEVSKDRVGKKAVAEPDRPREKLHAFGAAKLSNTELLAILLGTGSQELPILDLCDKIMRSVKDDPARLAIRTMEDLCRFKGVGLAKAATLIAAFELGKRAAAIS